jgi:Protein of unknown function DUF262/HNH endonuclease
MKIELKHIKIRDLVNGYHDNAATGQVVGYEGKLDIRPAYQREYVYKDQERNAVIDTVQKGFPLNVMYWVVNKDASNNETYEVLDGQQRTISICEYVAGNFSLHDLGFHNLTKDKKDAILDYELMVYFCQGTDSEKLEWFKTINIAGVKLSDQELRNSIYTGPWLSSAKDYFSKTSCIAYQQASDYMGGAPIRQEYLETVLDWVNNGNIEGYMALHQNDKDADALRQYFVKVINWVKLTFTVYRREMKGLPWGEFYDKYNTVTYNSNDLEDKIRKLMLDDEVTTKKGIYEYVLSDCTKASALSLRAFTEKDKAEAFTKQTGTDPNKATCPKCTKLFDFNAMAADHIDPWSKGGKTIALNCQMLCRPCNGTKSNH